MKRVWALVGLVAVLGLAGCSAAPSDESPSESDGGHLGSSAPESPPAAEAAPLEAESVEIYPNKPASTDLTCAAAVEQAAMVPASMTNNHEVYISLLACASAVEWGSMVVENPGVFAVSAVSPTEIDYYLELVCYGAEETPVCVDASN